MYTSYVNFKSKYIVQDYYKYMCLEATYKAGAYFSFHS